MGKYEQDARLLLEYVGGKENIAAVSHCVSRMRFVLNDPAKADVAKIESLKSAKGTFTQAGQFQVIINSETVMRIEIYYRFIGKTDDCLNRSVTPIKTKTESVAATDSIA